MTRSEGERTGSHLLAGPASTWTQVGKELAVHASNPLLKVVCGVQIVKQVQLAERHALQLRKASL